MQKLKRIIVSKKDNSATVSGRKDITILSIEKSNKENPNITLVVTLIDVNNQKVEHAPVNIDIIEVPYHFNSMFNLIISFDGLQDDTLTVEYVENIVIKEYQFLPNNTVSTLNDIRTLRANNENLNWNIRLIQPTDINESLYNLENLHIYRGEVELIASLFRLLEKEGLSSNQVDVNDLVENFHLYNHLYVFSS